MVHDVEWVAHYYHLLDTEVDSTKGANCVHVERDFSNLEAKVHYYNNHTKEAQQIATRARETFRERYTSPAATACYWRSLLRAWSTVSFDPVISTKGKGGKEKMRGISIEEFRYVREMVWISFGGTNVRTVCTSTMSISHTRRESTERTSETTAERNGLPLGLRWTRRPSPAFLH
jgi:hypothetical protein